MSPPRRLSRRLRLTREQVRQVDEHAIEVMGIPSLVLMENAGRNCADLIERWVSRRGDGASGSVSASLVCGRGNNGGDGFVIARQLANRGWRVTVDLAADRDALSIDASVNCAVAEAMEIKVHPLAPGPSLAAAARRWKRSSVLVDALLGTGFRGELREPLATIIVRINAVEGPLKVAVDVPSGFDVDEGRAGGTAVEADHTVTFVAEKTGFAVRGAKRWLGRVHVVDIGAPTELIVRRLGG